METLDMCPISKGEVIEVHMEGLEPGSDQHRALSYFLQEKYSEAVEVFVQLSLKYPENSNIKHLYGLTLHKLGKLDRATELISQALVVQPSNSKIHNSLGRILKERGKLVAATMRFRDAVRLDPTCIDSLCQLSAILVEQQMYHDAISVLNKALESNLNMDIIHGLLGDIFNKISMPLQAVYHGELSSYYHSFVREQVPLQDVVDTYFIDLDRAVRAATKQQKVQQTIAISALQLCYCSKNTSSSVPSNFIPVPLDNIVDFFLTTSLRFPKRVDFDPRDPTQRDLALRSANFLDFSQLLRRKATLELVTQSMKIGPEFPPKEGMFRIFLSASRLTTVMQYSSRDLANAFRNMGYKVKFLIETNEFDEYDFFVIAQEYAKFLPHITININHPNNTWLHPDVFNVIWWQDNMELLVKGDPIQLRNRDIVYSTYPLIDESLKKCGITHFYRQNMCVDKSVFFQKTPLSQRNKIVFVGSGSKYSFSEFIHSSETKKAYETLVSLIDSNTKLSTMSLNYISKSCNLEIAKIFHIFSDIIRERTIEWLCQLAPSLDMEVEIYGRYWERNDIIRNYYKYELPHGPMVAAVYNEAKYALSVNAMTVQSQRLSEISSCGCIPVVYDARSFSEPPLWDKECLFFSTKEELTDCLRLKPENDPIAISNQSSFEFFARRIIDKVENILSNTKEC